MNISPTISNEELLNKIKLSIKNKTPLSYVRMGDGEIVFLKSSDNVEDDELIIAEEALTSIFNRHNQVYHPIDSKNSLFYKKYKKIIIDSIKGSDYLGMFTYQEIIDLNNAGFYDIDDRYVPNKKVLESYDFDFNKIKTCSPMFNRFPGLGIIDNFKKLIGDERITIMTDMSEELKTNKKFQNTFGDNVDFISVNHQHASNADKSFYQREYIRSQFKNIQSHVVLYALGGGAKDLCNELKNDWGKCVIDMGSVLDAWGGVISRPSYGNIWSQCLTVPVNEAKETDICWR